MVKLKGPLFSLSASGALGPRLTYSMRGSGAQVRRQQANTNPNTAGQQIERGYYTDALAAWATLTDEEKAQWATFNNS